MVVVAFVGGGSEESQSNYLAILSQSLALSIRIRLAFDGFQEFSVIRRANALLGISAFQRLPHGRHDARIDRLSELAPMPRDKPGSCLRRACALRDSPNPWLRGR